MKGNGAEYFKCSKKILVFFFSHFLPAQFIYQLLKKKYSLPKDCIYT